MPQNQIMHKTRILITPGEPAGIGPDVCVQLAQELSAANSIIIADPDLLRQRAKQLGLVIRLNEDIESEQPEVNELKIIPIYTRAPVIAGQLNPENAAYVLETLQVAAQCCLLKKAQAIVTGPVHKGVINQAGVPFKGHTEFFADWCGVKQTVMLFVADQLKVALATTHLPLKDVSQAVTRELLSSVLLILHNELQQKFHLTKPKILVAGLNPHAGEGGYLGREEIDTMIPVLNELRAQGLWLEGPLPADTIFTPKYLQTADAILTMYHDQGLPLVKYASFGHAINVTLGLPFVRTSVDHGTALDIAGSGNADAGSMLAALRLAVELSAV